MYREANICANALAHIGCYLRSNVIFYESSLTQILYVFLDDKAKYKDIVTCNFSCKVSLKRSNNNTKSLKASQNSTWLHHWGRFVSCKDKFPINSSENKRVL
jgi:hypothetical protein